MAQTSIITGQNVRIQQTAATVLQRLIAWIIDSFVISIATMFFTISVSELTRNLVNYDLITAFLVITYLAIYLYPFWMEQFNNGQSLGKMAMKIRVVCSKGTYIRALARDIGEALHCGAHLTALRRTRVGDVGVEQCLDPEQFEAWLKEQIIIN